MKSAAYSFEKHTWEPQCPHGDICTGCDARGYCTRIEGSEAAARGCEVYWGSHGCTIPRGHEGPCECDCCVCIDHALDHGKNGCVAKPPYYGPDTFFYGDDAVIRGLQPHD